MEDRSLAGRAFLVAASEDQAPLLEDRLKQHGASVLMLPNVRIAPPEDFGPLDEAIRSWPSFDWIVFTTAHAVDAVASRARTLGVDLRLTRARIAAVGPVTRAALLRNGLPADAVPGEYLTKALAHLMGDLEGKRVLLPRSRLSRQSLPEELRSRGANVVQVNAYDAVLAPATSVGLPSAPADFLVLTSAASAENLSATLGQTQMDRLLEATPVAAIGPVTAEAARALGFRIEIIAREHSVEGLVRSLVEWSRHEQEASS